MALFNPISIGSAALVDPIKKAATDAINTIQPIQTMTMDTAPKATGVTSTQPPPPIPPVDPYIPMANQPSAITTAEQQAEKDRYTLAKQGQDQAASMALADQNKIQPNYVPPLNPAPITQPWDDPNYVEPTPPDASVYAGQGGAMVTADQNRVEPTSTPPLNSTFEQGSNIPSDPVPGDANYVAPAPPEPVQNPTMPPPPDSSESQADMDYIKNWYRTLAEAKDDPQGQRIVNNYINSIGLFNKAQQDGLQAKINQDPALRGQPAGNALAAMLARDQNSSLNDWLGKQSIASIDRIQQLNKLGIEGFAAASKAKQVLKQQDFENLITNLKTAQDIKVSEEGIKVSEEGIKTSEQGIKASEEGIKVSEQGLEDRKLANLISKLNIAKDVGDYSGIQKILNEDPVSQGLGITVDAAMLQATSPYTISLWNTNNAAINDRVKAGDAAGAKALYDDFRAAHPELKLPDMPLQSFDAKTFDATVARSQDIDEQIRTGILQKDDSKAKEGVSNYFTIGGHDPVAYANSLSLDDINKMRTDEGLSAWTQNDLVGINKVDLAKDYKLWSEKQNSKDNTISNLKETILSNPALKSAYTDPANKAHIDSFVADLALGNNITIDPATGRVSIKAGSVNPWEDPILQYQWKDFPVAQFDATGAVVPGSIAYAGGNFYADASQTGDNVNDTRDPRTATGQYNLGLQTKYENYIQTTPKDKVVGMQAWFYGTAAGTKPYDSTKVPGNIDGKPTGGNVDGTPTVIDPQTFISSFGTLKANEIQDKFKDPDFFKQAVELNLVPQMNNVANIPSKNSAWKEIAKNSYGFVSVNGVPFQVNPFPNGTITSMDDSGKNGSTISVEDIAGVAYPDAHINKEPVTTARLMDKDGNTVYMIVSGGLKGPDGKVYGAGSIITEDPKTQRHTSIKDLTAVV